jgi:hypothetical protein
VLLPQYRPWGLVRTDLDDLVIALYVTIDELLGPRRGPGHPPKLSDAELVCLAVAQVLLGARSERHWRRFVRDRLGHLFPYVPGQAGYNKRLRAAAHHLSLPSAIWRCDRRRGATGCGCWTPPAAMRAVPRDGQALGAVAPCRLRL